MPEPTNAAVPSPNLKGRDPDTDQYGFKIYLRFGSPTGALVTMRHAAELAPFLYAAQNVIKALGIHGRQISFASNRRRQPVRLSACAMPRGGQMCGALPTKAHFTTTAEKRATSAANAHTRRRWDYEASPSTRSAHIKVNGLLTSATTLPTRSGVPDILSVRFQQDATCQRSADRTEDQPVDGP